MPFEFVMWRQRSIRTSKDISTRQFKLRAKALSDSEGAADQRGAQRSAEGAGRESGLVHGGPRGQGERQGRGITRVLPRPRDDTESASARGQRSARRNASS